MSRERRPFACGQTGFSLLEVLVSLGLTLVVLSAMYGALISFKQVHFDRTQRTEVQQSLRACVDLMSRDLENAGFHMINNGFLARFGTVFPNTNATDAVTSDSITIWRNPDIAEASLTADMPSLSAPISVPADSGFLPDMQVAAIGQCADDTIRRETFTIDSILASGFLQPSSNLSCRFKAGAKVVFIEQVSYYLTTAIDGRPALARRVGSQPESLLVAGIQSLNFTYLDGSDPPAVLTPNDDASRREIRRIRVDVVGRAAARMRGTGIARELGLSFEFAPRNLVLQEIL